MIHLKFKSDWENGSGIIEMESIVYKTFLIFKFRKKNKNFVPTLKKNLQYLYSLTQSRVA